jgi:hypothetical protein
MQNAPTEDWLPLKLPLAENSQYFARTREDAKIAVQKH